MMLLVLGNEPFGFVGNEVLSRLRLGKLKAAVVPKLFSEFRS